MALGGTSIFGGVGSVWRTVLGVLMLGMITNGFDLLSVVDYWQNIVRGVLLSRLRVEAGYCCEAAAGAGRAV